MLDSAYSRIQNPEFKKALIESGVYITPSIESAEEQELIVSSVLRKKHDRITGSAIRDIVINMQDNNGNIPRETVNIFKRILNISKADDIDELHEVMNLLKDSSGNIDTGKTADFLAVYSQKDSSIDDAIKYVGDKYKLAYKVKVDPKKEKEENEIVERFKQYVNDCAKNPTVTSARMMEQIASQYSDILNRKCPEYIGFYNNQKRYNNGGAFSRASTGHTSMSRSRNVLESLLDD